MWNNIDSKLFRLPCSLFNPFLLDILYNFEHLLQISSSFHSGLTLLFLLFYSLLQHSLPPNHLIAPPVFPPCASTVFFLYPFLYPPSCTPSSTTRTPLMFPSCVLSLPYSTPTARLMYPSCTLSLSYCTPNVSFLYLPDPPICL